VSPIARIFIFGTGFVVASGVALDTKTHEEHRILTRLLPNVELVQPAHASTMCGQNLFACGDLEENGTCCRTDEQSCCNVPKGVGNCYCVTQGDKCDRYQR